MTSILGISAFFHDSAACLVQDGVIVAAASEERFSRRKGDPAFPAQAAAWCLKQGGVDARHLDAVAFYEKPILHLDRLFAALGLAQVALDEPDPIADIVAEAAAEIVDPDHFHAEPQARIGKV
jgi:predicted NodU family carbamoyl transferase